MIDGRTRRSHSKDKGCLPWLLALVAWMVLVESVDEVAGEEAGDNDKGFGMKGRERKDAGDDEWLQSSIVFQLP